MPIWFYVCTLLCRYAGFLCVLLCLYAVFLYSVLSVRCYVGMLLCLRAVCRYAVFFCTLLCLYAIMFVRHYVCTLLCWYAVLSCTVFSVVCFVCAFVMGYLCLRNRRDQHWHFLYVTDNQTEAEGDQSFMFAIFHWIVSHQRTVTFFITERFWNYAATQEVRGPELALMKPDLYSMSLCSRKLTLFKGLYITFERIHCKRRKWYEKGE